MGKRHKEEDEDEELVETQRRTAGKRSRAQYVEEDDDYDDEDEDEDEDDEEYGRGRSGKRRKRPAGMQFIDSEAIENDDDEEDDEEGDELDKDFLNDGDDDDIQGDEPLQDEDNAQREPMAYSSHRRPPPPLFDDNQEDVEQLEREVEERYRSQVQEDSDDDYDEVDQQALLPSVRDSKLWIVKCKIGYEREAAACLMHKSIANASQLKIRSVVALDHLKNYIYVEADKEAHVKEACRGMRNIYSSSKVMQVPLKEMTDVLAVQAKEVELPEGSWVRVKTGIYKGDLAKVVSVNNVRRRVEVQLIPRVSLQAIADKLDGIEEAFKTKFSPPQRPMNVEKAKEMHIPVDQRQDRITGDYFYMIGGMKFREGFLLKTMAIRSVSSQNVKPTLDELEKFVTTPQEDENDDIISDFSALFADRKKCHFMKGDAVVVVGGDLKNARGRVEKVEDEIVHIRPDIKDFPRIVPINGKHLCKYFKAGNHVKVVSGVYEGVTGMVTKVEGHVLIIVSDATKENIRVFADHVVDSSEVTTGLTGIGEYEMHDLILLDNGFGVIVRIEAEAFRVLKGNPAKSESELVRLREIKTKVGKKFSTQDRCRNTVSVKDIVRIVEGPYRDKQGTVEHIYGGVVFIIDRHHLENAGYICARAQSCIVKGGSVSHSNDNRYAAYPPRAAPQSPWSPRRPHVRHAPQSQQSPRRSDARYSRESEGRQRSGGSGHNLVGTRVVIRSGPFKGYRGVVKDVNGQTVRLELESQMKVVTVNRDVITTSQRETPPYGLGSETPMHCSRTPLRPFATTPMRDPGATTPIHEGMRTPKYDPNNPAWYPRTPLWSPVHDPTNPTYAPLTP